MDTTRDESGVALVVMGPAACGKSEVASALANHYKCEYLDADYLHTPSNIQKMSTGIPLTDNDRFPWLKTVREKLVTVYRNSNNQNVRVVVACSSLKKVYRDILSGNYVGVDDSPVRDSALELRTYFVFLNCSECVLAERISKREGHFMKPNMLQSQLNTLEKPGPDEQAIVVDGDQSLTLIIADVVQKLENVF